MSFVGTSLPEDAISYVSIGTLRMCNINPSTPASTTGLTCSILNMIAGSHDVYVQTTQGAIANSGSIDKLEVEIEVDSVTPPAFHTSGGQTVIITGKFFPQTLTEANSFSDFSVKFTGDKSCIVTLVTSSKIICTSPQGMTDNSQVTVAFNGKSKMYASTFGVTESDDSVVSVDKSSICPVLKQDIVITVSATSSSNPDEYTAILMNEDTTIHMRVNSVDQSSKQLTARFPGSPKNAIYYVYIEQGGVRFKSSVTINAKSTIESIEIITGDGSKSEISTTGGDIVKIDGTGFSTVLSDNIVMIGSYYSDVLTATETELTVRAGKASVSGSSEVMVFLKLSIESKCNFGGGV